MLDEPTWEEMFAADWEHWRSVKRAEVMAVRVVQGDSRDVIPTLGENALRGSLDRGVSAPMTGAAEGDQVGQVIGLSVVAEKPIGPHMMHVMTRLVAMLASVAVARPRLALLCHPIWAAMMNRIPDELRMKLANACRIPARARAKLSISLGALRCWALKWGAASDADKGRDLLRLCPLRSILACRRARFPATISEAVRRDKKLYPASLAGCWNSRPHEGIVPK